MDVEEFCERLQDAVDLRLRDFEARFGYPPDLQRIERRSEPPAFSEAVWSDVDPDLRHFFEQVDTISLPDIWNGYFLGPVTEIEARFQAGEPATALINGLAVQVLVVGSDGGGALYVVPMGLGSPVIRFVEASLTNGLLHGGTSNQISATWAEFMTRFVQEVEALARDDVSPTI